MQWWTERSLRLALLVSGVAAFLTRCVSLGLYCSGREVDELFVRNSWIGMTAVDLSILAWGVLRPYCSLFYFIPIVRRYLDRERWPPILDKFVRVWFGICNLFLFVTTIVLVTSNGSELLLDDEWDTVPIGVAGVIFEVLGAAFTSIYFAIYITVQAMGMVMIAQSTISMVSVLQLLISIIGLWVNSLERLAPNDTQFNGRLPEEAKSMRHSVRTFTYFVSVLMFFAGIGVALAVSISASSRLNESSRRLISVYCIGCFISEAISIAYFGIACHNVRVINKLIGLYGDVKVADPVLAACSMILNFVGIICALVILQKPRSPLQVEVVDLNQFTPKQIEILAKVLDEYNRKLVPGNASGAEMLSLMEAYVESPLAHMHCQVIRVYDPDTATDSAIKSEEIEKQDASLETTQKYYEKVKAWDRLDRPPIFEEVVDKPPQAAKKNKNKKKKATNSKNMLIEGLLGDNATSEEDELFREFLVKSEALILLTIIDDYDLTNTLPGDNKFTRLVSRLLGSQSYLKLLSVRIGLLATHFPFRQAIMYMSPTKKPVARAAAVCSAVAQWNASLPRQSRCNLLLDPAFAHSGMGEEFQPSGWIPGPLPPTHVIDLRPYESTCRTGKDYLKAIKYRDQSTTFVKAKGEVVELKTFTQEDCETAMELWANIAMKRTSDGHTAVLATPNADFLRSLGTTANEKGYRTLLFLKVDGQVIASCILFRLGVTITSDIQGLDHEVGRKYKAYFVMMQETINIALREGIKFVDFGPTTGKAKMDIGSKEVSLVGGMWAQQPLKTMISTFAQSVQ